ncbi:hypothetical protein LTR84_007471 [Exophiala bonariae]|uniref:Uncharacterized protein n=1 Tax=Exophiala bonariae TaxID=1690606 RepID=A0AAV9MYL1_9EURO|nr:hypothetical protein LTR84_007471 [Exophiala bonariae]
MSDKAIYYSLDGWSKLSPAERDKRTFDDSQKLIDEVKVFLKDTKDYANPSHTEDDYNVMKDKMRECQRELQYAQRFLTDFVDDRNGETMEQELCLRDQLGEMRQFYVKQMPRVERVLYERGAKVKIDLCQGERLVASEIQEKEMTAEDAMKILDDKVATLEDKMSHPKAAAGAPFDVDKGLRLRITLSELSKQLDTFSPRLDQASNFLGRNRQDDVKHARYRQEDAPAYIWNRFRE